ncbi:hypothetical protein [Chondromyces apiculatus]|nr:hypothetical protein [Chondromyces apiculatus]
MSQPPRVPHASRPPTLSRSARLSRALRLSLAGLALSAAGAILAVVQVSGCSVGDQFCREGFSAQPGSKAADCPYGEKGGPTRENISCPVPPKPAVCRYVWSQVYAVLDDPSKGACTTQGCHGEGGTLGDGLAIPSGNAVSAWSVLTTYESDVKGKYINPGSPTESWIVCNVQGSEEGGSPMPKPNGLLEEADVQMVRDWFACWRDSPAEYGQNAAPIEGVGGAGGGAGGAGGAGGGP